MHSLSFQGAPANYLLMMQLQEQRKAKQTEALKQYINNQALLPPRNYNPQGSGSGIKFGVDPLTGWALATTGDQAAKHYLKASPEKYKKIEKYSVCPKTLSDGHTNLATAKKASNPQYYYEQAEQKFIEASNDSTVGTIKSYALRLAAIAAKLRGDTSAAKEHMSQAKKARFKAEGPGPEWIGPKKDWSNLEAECRDASTKTTTFLKRVILAPINLTGDFKNDPVIRATAPYNTKIDEAHEILGSKYNELKGEVSDDEWIKDNDPKRKGTSKGKGLRHTYL